MLRIDQRPMQAILAMLLVLCVASPAALADETLRYPVHDPKTFKPGSLLATANVMLTHDESGDAESLRRARQAIREQLEERERNAQWNQAGVLVSSWDVIMTALVAQAAVRLFADRLPEQYQQPVRALDPDVVLRAEDGTETKMPANLGLLYGIEKLSRADKRLRAVEGRLELPNRVTLRGQGDCSLAEGTFDVTRQGHLVELSNDAYAAYFGTTSDKELWLHLNEERWASAKLGEYINIAAPLDPGQLLVLTPMLTPEGQGFAGAQWQKPDCRIEIRPVKD